MPAEQTLQVTYIEDAGTEADGSNVQSINTADDLLYMIYTSGTTGKPKGVLLEHKNMANLLSHQLTNTDIDFCTNVLQYASVAFDVCYQELFSVLLSGGTLCIVPESIKRDVSQLFSFIDQHNTEVVFFPTAFVKMLFNEEGYAQSFPRCVKHVITAGEQLTVSRLFRQTLRLHGMHLHNHYYRQKLMWFQRIRFLREMTYLNIRRSGNRSIITRCIFSAKIGSFSLSELRENCIFPARIQEEAM